jgi:hypothetical protein
MSALAAVLRVVEITAHKKPSEEQDRRIVALIPHRRELLRHRMGVSDTTRQSVHA